MPGPRSLLVATAGHVDHGKSTLVRHLTGVDPDRLAEERRRGLTIELGFAVASLPSGAEVSFVDVPGHARFLATMVAGVGAVSCCLFVVSAVEGWRAQSEEHLRVLQLLGASDGVVALTRAAAVDATALAAREAEVGAAVAGTFLAGRPVVAVDTPAGLGTRALLAALDDLVDRAAPAPDRGRPRLWVDRSFTIAGAGTVVTGSLADGGLSVGDTVDVVTGAATRAGRVRGIEVHGRAVDRVGPGARTALNLAGVDRDEVARGAVVVQADRWHRTDVVDVALTVLAGAPAVRSGRGAHLLHVGTDDQAVHVRAIGAPSVAPGTTAPARLRLRRPLPLLPGDRFVLRDTGRGVTVGGGVVLDVEPVVPTTRAAPDRDPARVVAERGWVDVDHLERLTGTRVPETVAGWVGAPDVVASDRARLAALVTAAGAAGLALDGLARRDRLLVRTVAGVEVAAGRARAGGATPAASPYLRTLRADPFRPPGPVEARCAPEELRALRAAGLVAHHDGTYFARDAVDEAAAVVAGLLVRRPEGVTVGEVRQALGTTRRWALPLLAILDAEGVTRRREGLRLAGPRLPASEAGGGAGG